MASTRTQQSRSSCPTHSGSHPESHPGSHPAARANRGWALLALLLALVCPAAAMSAPLKIAYSDWPGWVAWEVAVEKKMFAKKGVEAEFFWFDYVASMDAFAAGQVDAVAMTNGDTLVTGATGAAAVMILLNDYSNGNDMVVARPGITELKQLKGKKIGVEVGFVSHLLLLDGLTKAGLKESDVTLVNMPTNEAAQVLASGDVDAVVAWQPNSGQALAQLPGSKAIYTSADSPGLIYDTLAVRPDSLSSRRADWTKVVEVWYEAVAFIQDPKTHAEAVKIMSARAGVDPAKYEKLMEGTKILTLDEALAFAGKGAGFDSIYGSTKASDDFQVSNKVYEKAQKIDRYIDMSIMQALKK
jgi:NitT/TauT family transport system substrate-binding protein